MVDCVNSSETICAAEGTTIVRTVNILDENDQPISKANLDRLVLTLKDDLTGTIINGRNESNILDTGGGAMGATDGILTLTLSPADTAVLDTTKRFQTYTAIIEWEYGGNTKIGKLSFYLQVENLSRSCWQNFINRVALRLGAGCRVLEMEDDHWCEAIQQAMDLLSNYIYRGEWAHLPNVSGTNQTVNFSDAQSATYDPDLLRVVNVQFAHPVDEGLAVEQDVFTLSERLAYGGRTHRYGGGRGYGVMAPVGRIGLGDIATQKHYREAQLRVTGKDPDWLWDQNLRTLVLSMPTGGPYDITYLKAYPYTPGTLPQNYMRYFLEAVEGYSRLMIADIRGKFGQLIPGPTGGAEIDAQVQLQRGQELIQKVEEALRNFPMVAYPEFG